jgi:hypothetical protein
MAFADGRRTAEWSVFQTVPRGVIGATVCTESAKKTSSEIDLLAHVALMTNALVTKAPSDGNAEGCCIKRLRCCH